jgi:hypothetical protein
MIHPEITAGFHLHPAEAAVAELRLPSEVADLVVEPQGVHLGFPSDEQVDADHGAVLGALLAGEDPEARARRSCDHAPDASGHHLTEVVHAALRIEHLDLHRRLRGAGAHRRVRSSPQRPAGWLDNRDRCPGEAVAHRPGLAAEENFALDRAGSGLPRRPGR